MYREEIIKKYGRQLVFPMSAMRDEELFLSFMEQVGHVETIIEMGTYAGLSTILLSKFADVVHTFDVVNYNLRDSIWKHFDVNNVVFHHIRDNEEKRKIVDTLDFQFAFIDGNHHGVETDYLMTKRCGKLLFHDYEHGFPEDNCRTMVVKFVDSIEGVVRIDEPFALWAGPVIKKQEPRDVYYNGRIKNDSPKTIR